MTVDYSSFAKASTLIHLFQGIALIGLGAAEAYALDNPGRKAPLFSALLLAACGAAGVVAVLALPGGWSLEQLGVALNLRRGFYLFIAFSCLFCAAGLSRVTQTAIGRDGGGWRNLFLLLLAAAGALYFLLAWRVNVEVRREVLVLHSTMGVTLLLAVAAKAAHIITGRRRLHIAWAVLLLVTGLQLATYREKREAFEIRLITMQAGPQNGLPPAKAIDATTADKERPRR